MNKRGIILIKKITRRKWIKISLHSQERKNEKIKINWKKNVRRKLEKRCRIQRRRGIKSF